MSERGWPSPLAQKGSQELASPTVPRPQMPTPLYVTGSNKKVILRFNTQEEADTAWRYLSALAEAHADRTHKEKEDEEASNRRLLHGPNTD